MTWFGWLLVAYMALAVVMQVARIGTVRSKADAVGAVIEAPLIIAGIILVGTGSL